MKNRCYIINLLFQVKVCIYPGTKLKVFPEFHPQKLIPQNMAFLGYSSAKIYSANNFFPKVTTNGSKQL